MLAAAPTKRLIRARARPPVRGCGRRGKKAQYPDLPVSVSDRPGLNSIPKSGFGAGGSLDLSFKDGLKPSGYISGGKFGLSGDAGITFTEPGLSGPQTYNLSLAGGAGPGGAISISFGPNLMPTNVSVTIDVGFGWEVSGNIPFFGNGNSGGKKPGP